MSGKLKMPYPPMSEGSTKSGPSMSMSSPTRISLVAVTRYTCVAMRSWTRRVSGGRARDKPISHLHGIDDGENTALRRSHQLRKAG